jgi:hypothetical protein
MEHHVHGLRSCTKPQAKGEVDRAEAKRVRHVLNQNAPLRWQRIDGLPELDKPASREPIRQSVHADAGVFGALRAARWSEDVGMRSPFGKSECHLANVVAYTAHLWGILTRNQGDRWHGRHYPAHRRPNMAR